MKITAVAIADANSRMAEIAKDSSVGDGDRRLARMAEIWRPIADATRGPEVPPAAANVGARLGDDVIGVADDGRVIAWGEPEPMPDTHRTWRPLVILGPGR